MRNKINNGPEIYDPDTLKVEYSRSEREQMTRYVNGRNRMGARKFSLRIILLDLLLLCIIGGIIYPFIITRNKTGTLDGIRCDLSLRSDKETLYVSVILDNPDGGVPSGTVDLEFFINDRAVEKFSDLTPKPGEQRTIRFKTERGDGNTGVRVTIIKGKEMLKLNASFPAR